MTLINDRGEVSCSKGRSVGSAETGARHDLRDRFCTVSQGRKNLEGRTRSERGAPGRNKKRGRKERRDCVPKITISNREKR